MCAMTGKIREFVIILLLNIGFDSLFEFFEFCVVFPILRVFFLFNDYLYVTALKLFNVQCILLFIF